MMRTKYKIIATLPKEGYGWADIFIDGELIMSVFGAITVRYGLLQDRWMIDVRMENNLCVASFYADAIVRGS